jgi:hypothetical protein
VIREVSRFIEGFSSHNVSYVKGLEMERFE